MGLILRSPEIQNIKEGIALEYGGDGESLCYYAYPYVYVVCSFGLKV